MLNFVEDVMRIKSSRFNYMALAAKGRLGKSVNATE
jgi:hypothetical protein